MKKIITLVLALCMVLTTLTACGNTTAKTAKVIDIDLTSEEYAFGVDKTQPELLTKVNEFMVIRKEVLVEMGYKLSNRKLIGLEDNKEYKNYYIKK